MQGHCEGSAEILGWREQKRLSTLHFTCFSQKQCARRMRLLASLLMRNGRKYQQGTQLWHQSLHRAALRCPALLSPPTSNTLHSHTVPFLPQLDPGNRPARSPVKLCVAASHPDKVSLDVTFCMQSIDYLERKLRANGFDNS